MRFNKHSNLEGAHAFLGASKYHWVNYDDEKLMRVFTNQFDAQIGTRKHAWAAEAIRLGLRQKRDNTTLNSYINDAIGYRMEPEVMLYYSHNCFGTADAIGFRDSRLRVHDLKTGVHPGKFTQTEIYCALFCLEYRVNPFDIEMEMRIYQSDEIFKSTADPKWIRELMKKIEHADKIIEDMREVNR